MRIHPSGGEGFWCDEVGHGRGYEADEVRSNEAGERGTSSSAVRPWSSSGRRRGTTNERDYGGGRREGRWVGRRSGVEGGGKEGRSACMHACMGFGRREERRKDGGRGFYDTYLPTSSPFMMRSHINRRGGEKPEWEGLGEGLGFKKASPKPFRGKRTKPFV
jgi:hypothetical protein